MTVGLGVDSTSSWVVMRIATKLIQCLLPLDEHAKPSEDKVGYGAIIVGERAREQ